jgi:restriction endonuclease Mrr
MGLLNYQEYILEDEIDELPRQALVAFAARSARRVQPLVITYLRKTQSAQVVERVLTLAEQQESTFSPSFDDFTFLKLITDGSQWAAEVADSAFNSDDIKAAAWAAQAAYTVGHLIFSVHQDREQKRSDWVTYWAHNAISDAIRAASISEEARERFGRELRADFEKLRAAAKAGNWTDEVIVSSEFFPVHSEFDTNAQIGQNTIIEISSVIDAKLIEYFRQNPKRLYELHPRQFEELIAELFDGFGFDVELTKWTRDGGYDIVAIGHRIIKLKCLIECKRYKKEHNIGVSTVRALHGVTVTQGANKGILATTTFFSKPAKEYFEHNRWILEGRDFDGLVQWLDEYQRIQMTRTLGLLDKRLQRDKNA